MLNDSILKRYRQIRRIDPFYPAKPALQLARYETSDGPLWHWGEEIERDGFTLVFRIEHDDYFSSSPGTFSDRPLNEGSIKNPDGWTSHGNRNHHFLAYFTPEVSETEQYEGLRKCNYGKTQARELAHSYVMEDLKRAKENSAYVVIATAYRAGIELASHALGGIDDDGRYAKQCAEDIASEAISEAREILKRLQKEDEQ